MNWPQSSYSSSTNSSSIFGGNSSGYGTPGGGQQQQPQQSQQQGMYGGQQSGYGGTPGSGSLYSSAGGFQSTAPSGLQQQTFSTSSPQQQQQRQGQQQPQHMMGGSQMQQNNMQGLGYQSQFGNSSSGNNGNGMGSSYGQQPQQGGQMMMSAGSGYGQYQQQQHPSSQQPGYGSPAQGPAMQGGSGAPSTGVGRYLPGYLTASSLSGSPRQSTSSSNNHDGRLSPEQSHRDTGSSFGAGSSRLFASSTSSAGTAGRESPSRSPKQSLFSSSAYGSSRSLALTPATGSRPRRTSSNTLVRPSHEDYMEEDAPPVDTLDDFDNDAGVPYVSSPPPSQPAPIAASSPSKRQIGLPNGPTSSSFGQQQAPNGQSSSNGSNNIYKLIVFGFPPNLQSSVLKEFASIAPLVYNSIQDPSSSASTPTTSTSDLPPTGSNWFTIAYDNDWAALRALRKNGDIIAGSAMIGVKWADSTKALDSGMDLIPQQQQQQQQTTTTTQQQSLPRSSTASNLGTPATILPASQAFLPKSNSNGASAMRKSATLNRINEMGKIDPSIFKQPDSQQQQQKQGGGVVGTLTNLIFGF